MLLRQAFAFLIAVAAIIIVAKPAAAARFHITMVLYRGETEVEAGFREYLAQSGLDAEITVRNIDRDVKRLPAIVQEIKAQHPDLVYTWGTSIALQIGGRFDDPDPTTHVTDIPIVAALVSDPVGTHLIRSREHPDRNLTGVVHIVPVESQVHAMAEYRPLHVLGMLYNPSEPSSVANVAALHAIEASAHFRLIAEPVPLDARGMPAPESVPTLVKKVAAQGIDFMYIGPDTFIGDQRDAYTTASIAAGVPVFTGTQLEILSSRAMVGLVSPYKNVGQYAGAKAVKILVDHVTPGDIPFDALKHFSYIVRIDVARQLKLYPPMQVLRYAELVGR
jgi:putative ABC transport system substrate-binding protein